MTKPKAIIYDFDGTILNTLPWHLRAYRKTLKKFDIDAPDDEIIKKCFNIVDSVAAANFGIKDTALFSRYYREGAREGFRQAELHEHIIETLTQLNEQGYTVCLGSLARKSDFDPALERFDLKKLFKEILTFDQCPHEKPTIFRTLAEKVVTDTSTVLIVGDALNDIEAAKAMNTPVILYHNPMHERFYSRASLETQNPDYIIEDHLDIIKLLK